MIQKRPYRIFTVTPTLDTSAYASGDRLGSIVRLADMFGPSQGAAKLSSLVVLDKATQSQSLDLILFSQLPTIASADNAAIDISDTEAEKIVGEVSVITTDYKATASNSTATIKGIDLLVQAVQSNANERGRDLWFLLVCRSGTPTYAANSLVLQLKFEIM